MKKTTLRTCRKCGWVHFGITKAKAMAEVRKFNAYFRTLDKEKQQSFYGGRQSSLRLYLRCFRCDASWHHFRLARTGDVGLGCTLNPIIAKDL